MGEIMAIGEFTVKDLQNVVKNANLNSDLTTEIIIYMEDDDICTNICAAEIIKQDNKYCLKLTPDTDYKKEKNNGKSLY